MNKIIHQTWKNKNIPNDTFKRNWVESWKNLNPTWEYKLWTDEDMHDFISTKYSWFIPTFEAYPEQIQRVDSFRYFIIYEYGGLYADLDIECFKPLDTLLTDNCIIFQTYPEHQMKAIIDADNREHPLRKHFPLHKLKKGFFLTNSIFYSNGGHKFFKKCIEGLEKSYEESKRYRFTEFDFLNKSCVCNTHITMSAGSGFLTRMFFKYGRVFDVKDYSYGFFEPYKHTRRKEILLNQEAFNKENLYGMHWNIGTWINLEDSEYKI